jgi:hypothetical protein
MTSTNAPSVGICILRVEIQAENTIIVVTTKRDIARHLHSTVEHRPQYFTDPEDALDAVARFLSPFKGLRKAE